MTQNTALKTVQNIPFIDLAYQQSLIQDEIKAAIDKVLAHGKYIMGPEVKAIEETLSQACGARHTISCSSGTDAIVMALMALDVRAGDAVLVPSFTFAATAEAVAILGAIPVFVDVNADDYNLSLKSLESAYTSAKQEQLNVAGIIAVDLFGLPANYDSIESFSKTNDLWVIADSAQSFGGKYKDKYVGTSGLITTTSFFPAKPLGCYGDGGAIFTDNDKIAEKLRSIRVHGKGSNKYDNVRLGVNGRLDTIQAAILLEKHKIFESEIEKRNKIARYYNEGLKDIVKIPVIDNERLCTWAQYTVQVENAEERSRITASLKEAGVPTAIYYPMPLHQQTCYKPYPAAPDMSTCEALSQKVFSLPMHPYLTSETQDYIIEALKKAVASR